MPPFLQGLSVVGTAAMLWVGGGIVLHGLESFGLHQVAAALHALEQAAAGVLPAAGGALGWLAGALASGLAGLLLGAALIPLTERVLAPVVRAIRKRLRR